MPAFEIVLRLALQLLGNGIQNHGLLRNFLSGKFHAYSQHTVKPKNLRQARFTVEVEEIFRHRALQMQEEPALGGFAVQMLCNLMLSVRSLSIVRIISSSERPNRSSFETTITSSGRR